MLSQKKEKQSITYAAQPKREVIHNGRKKVDKSQVKDVKKRIPHHPHHGLRLF